MMYAAIPPNPVMNASSFDFRAQNGQVEATAKQRQVLAEWLKSLMPDLDLPTNCTEELLRTYLIDGTVVCRILNRLRPNSVDEIQYPDFRSENVKKFLAAVDDMGLPGFKVSDLEKGSMKPVLDCLSTLRAQFMPIVGGDAVARYGNKASNSPSPTLEDRRKSLSESSFQRALRNPVLSESTAASLHQVGTKFHEVFQLKQGRYADLPAAKITEMVKSNSLDNAPTQSLLSVVNGILEESVERKNGEIPQRVALLLRKVVQEIERRISTQAEHLRTQNNLFKAREEKYQSRIRVLEALATGTNQETQIVMDQLQQIKTERIKMEEQKKSEEQDAEKVVKEREQNNLEISKLREQNNLEISNLREQYNLEISKLKQELDIARKAHQQKCLKIETDAKRPIEELELKLKHLEGLLADSSNKVKELEVTSQSKHLRWNKKEDKYLKVMTCQINMLQVLLNAAENYHAVLAENRKLYNEVQDLKGNIRVFCRIRPLFSGQSENQTTIEHVGEHGELVVANPSKPGKDGLRMFRFNKVYGPSASQAGVFLDTQPLIRSVLDGYNVCIFAYGQTGSGKTYTMIGPNGATKEDWGVNFRALNDLFEISQARKILFSYEICVQMVEIYNEQVRDLLSSDASQKRYPSVPDASILPVKSTNDVISLMDVGLKNRAMGATAMNARSSRSHSVLTIHVRGTDLKSGATLRGSLHLVDLAGSERLDRSEATGDRLKEAQHINKSLSALGDVIFALAQKSPHVPYRNSKLTQVLQTSLGGQAKTLMFVQLNPDVNSYSETMSTLKFAERVSGVELGAAKSSKEGKDVRDLMEQVASLRDTITKKDEEIERLQLLKDLKSVYPNPNSEKRVVSSTSSKHSNIETQQFKDDLNHQNEHLRQSKIAGGIEPDDQPERTPDRLRISQRSER
uniref:Kinesin-like protein n=1 Tax=Kalanchoe fedtschenkoi TaxID=63787 RepID=A0A7N0TKR0_KALFE